MIDLHDADREPLEWHRNSHTRKYTKNYTPDNMPFYECEADSPQSWTVRCNLPTFEFVREHLRTVKEAVEVAEDHYWNVYWPALLSPPGAECSKCRMKAIGIVEFTIYPAWKFWKLSEIRYTCANHLRATLTEIGTHKVRHIGMLP